MIRFLQRLALGAARHARATFVVFAVLIVTALGLASRLRFDTDVLNLLPRRDPAVVTFRRFVEEFGGLDLMLVAVRIPEGAPVEPYEELADKLGPEFEKLPQLEYVDYRVGDLSELVNTFLPRALLFLDQRGLEAVGEKLRPEAMQIRARELRRQIVAPQSLALKQIFLLDPLGLSEVLLDRLGKAPGALSVDISSGYYLSRDRRMLLIVAKPRRPAQDIDFDEALVAATRGAIARTSAGWSEMTGGQPLPKPELLIGGSYMTALEDAKLIRGDLVLNIGSSLVLVLLLFLWAFRRLGPLFFALLPLLAGVTMTFGFAAVAIGTLSTATSGVAAMIIGLGIDFVIIEYGRYVEERRHGRSVGTALRRVVAGPVPGIIYGALTTAATFLAFLVTDFAGLQQMGLLAGIGILLCLLSVLLLMPAMLSWSRLFRRGRARPRMTLHAFGTQHLARWGYARPRATLLVCTAVTALAAWGIHGLRFTGDIQSMRSPKNEGIRVLEEVNKHFGSGFESMSAIVTGNSEQEALALSARVAERARSLVQQGVLQSYDAVGTILPPPDRQEQAVGWLLAHRADGLTDPARVARDLAAALAAAGLRAETFAPGIELLRQAIAVEHPIASADFASRPRTARLLERYLRKTPEGYKSIVKLYPPGRRWKRDLSSRVEAAMRDLGPEVEVTGVNVVSLHLRQRVIHEATVAGVLGFVVVCALLFFSFRRWRDIWLSLLPLAVGIVWMFGAMALFHIDLNQMNIFVTTMILGIGVDYGVHVLYRYNEFAQRTQAEIATGLSETAKAVVLSAMTTVIGFGSLATSRYPGLRSVGYVATLGCFSCAIVAVTLLPALLAVAQRGRRAAEAAGALSAGPPG